MNWFKYFRLLGNKKKAPISKAARPRLRLEELEVREVPAAPFVVGTTPATGGLLGAPPLNAPQRIEVVFSEDVMGANNKNNFLMFASDGTPVNIASVGYNAGTFTSTILASNLTVNGGALPAGVYSLFLRGDQIVDVDENLPLARPGELVVANAGRNSLSTVALNGTGLGAVSTISLPIQGTNNYLPSGVATGDVNADMIPDLIVTSAGQNSLNIHLGNGNGFSTSPDLTIGLSASPSGVLLAELNGDAANAGKNEIVLVNSAAGTVTVFVNQNPAPGSLAFDSGTSYSVGSTPSGVVAGLFNDDTNVDLAVSNTGLDASNQYTANVITGKGDGTFNATTAFVIGTSGPSGTVSPTGIAVGRFNGDTQDDLVVSGTTFLSVLTNTSNSATPTFGVSTIGITGITASSVATGSLTTGTGIPGNGKGTQDIVATTTAGNVISFVNDGTGAFDAAPSFTAGVASPIGLQMRDLTGDGRQELVYVNGAAAGGAVSRAPIFRSVANVGDAQGNGTDPIEITAPGHGLSTGDFVIIRGVTGFPEANGGFTVTVPGPGGANTFTLNGTASFTGNANNNTGSVFFASPQVIQNAVKGPATAPELNRIVITSANHGLRSGQQVTITGATGTTVINNTFYITRLTADTFALNGTEATAIGGTYNANTASWALPVYATGATPTGLALADFTGDGILDLVTSNKTDNTTGSLSYYSGSGTAGVGDGTFLANTSLPLLTNGVPRATAVGDLNGDGIPDLVATDFKNNTINIFLGLAGGGYGAPSSKSLTTGGNSREPVSVAIGDLNNDNKLDVVVASQRDNVAALFTGNGNGTVNNQTRITVGSTPKQVVLADVNDDGDLDLLVAHNGKSRGVTLRLGNGNGTFQNSTEIFGLSNTPRASSLAVGDFNRDGFTDVVVTDDVTNGTGTVRVALGSGNGSFPSGNRTTYTVGANPTSVVVADFNADGFADIATASRSNSTTENISVLLNNVGTGFQSAIHTQLTTDPIVNGSVLHRLQAVNVNSDAFIDLVVTAGIIDAVNNTTTKNGADGVPDKDTPNPANNTFVLYGAGDGSFTATVNQYTVAGPSATSPPPVPFASAVEVVSDPFRLLSTFNVGGTTVSANLLRNGSFENRALSGEQGNLDGWNVFRLTDTTRGSAGQFLAQTGANSPLSLSTVPPPANGRYRAMLDQQHLQPFSGNTNPNDDASYAGSHALYQDVTIPGNATSARLSFTLYLNSDDPFTEIGASGTANTDDPLLDYRTTDPNQQVRVDIMSINNNILGLGTNVRQNLFKTQTNTTTNGTLAFTGNGSFDLSAFAGQTIRVRFAATNNQGKLMVGVDDARVQVVFTDNTAPVIQTLNLRNPTFLTSANNTPQSTDPTLVGRITDNGSINNVSKLTFDLGNNGFGGADDVSITTFDANGYFTFTPTTLLPGLLTVPVRAFDQAGNFAQQTTTFILQGPSLTNWQAAGPGPIDISGAGLNYSTVSGKITGVAVDPSDPSGNTFYVSSSNGGVWKTVDGGEDWLALTDNVRDATGERINVSAGGLTLGVNPQTNTRVIYAATGVDDNAFTSRSSVGVLQSLDDGRTWRVLGGATRNAAGAIIPGIFTGARVSKVVVDPSNPAIVYVAVTSWDTTTKAPMILKTTNGLAATPTWTNVLIPANMFVNNRTDTLLSLSQGLASVTDIIVDPFNPGRVIVGLGNIGQFISGEGAGVWKSIDGGSTWDRIEGGDSLALQNATYDGTLPFGANVGRVTLAQGNGRVGDERFVYVMMADAVSTTNQFNQGGYMGLYKSKDNMLNFTKVMLRQPGLGHARFTEIYEDIELLGNEGGNVGALVVDPSNPNVVYVGGSRRFTDPGDPPQHALIRVDTGNMRDTDYTDADGLTNDGDDRDKAGAAALAGDIYPTGTDQSGNTIGGVDYEGEGVYWYDIEQSRASDSSTRRRLPPSIHRLTFDPQGRLIIGTENGLFRGVPLGFGYDFRSSFAGILASGGSSAFNPPGMTITDLNNNLQITDLTSVAIDPTDRSRFYVSAAGVGSGLTPGGLTSWQTMGLTGPNTATLGNLGIPNSFQVLAANLAPDAPADAVTTLYRTWQFDGAGSLIPEVSADAGGSFDTTGSAGISSQDTSNLAPVLAINSVKAEVNGQFFDELLFGTNKVYLTRTGGNVWDAISGNLGAGFVSALAFSPSQGEYLAGTDEAKVFIKSKTGNNFVEITNNLATLIGLTLTIRINGITVDPTNRNSVYVMAATANGRNSVFRGTLTRNAAGSVTGASWVAVTGGLPLAASYKMIIDRRPSTGAPNGRFYVGTDRGVFTSTDGASWTPLGAGLPAAPVVDLQFNPTFEILAAATQGRGVFTISTARSGPAIVDVTPATPVDNGPLTQVNVTFNTPLDPRTFNADQNNIARTVLSLIALTTTDVADVRVRELIQQYQRRVANAGDVSAARPTFFFQDASGNIEQVPDAALAGGSINRTRDDGELRYTAFLVAADNYVTTVSNMRPIDGAISATEHENRKWLESVWLDLLGRSSGLTTLSTGDDDAAAAAFLTQLQTNPGQATRFGIALQLTGVNRVNNADPNSAYATINPLSKEFHTNLVASLFNKFLGRNYPAVGASSTEIDTQVATLQRRGLLRNVNARIISTTEAYSKLGNDLGLPSGTEATAIAFGNFTGRTVSSDNGTGATRTNVPVLDMAVATNGNRVLIYQGKAGGGFATTPTLNFALPAGANPADLLVADLNGDGMADLAVANSGLASGGNNSVSVFFNNRAAVGDLSFAARTDLNGGENPIAVAAADYDGDAVLDLITTGRTTVSNNFNVNVRLGTGGGNFAAPVAVKIGDTTPTGAELSAPTGLAVANVTGGARPDLIVSGDNGLVVFNNTSTPGNLTGALLAARLTNTPTTSVAVGNLDVDDTDNDIVATSDAAAGEMLLFRNDSGAFPAAGQFTTPAGTAPRSVKLADMNGDGKLDAVVVNKSLVGGAITVLYNTTVNAPSAPDAITFQAPFAYPITGTLPSVVALGDTNQDGIVDAAFGYEGSEFVSQYVGAQQGLMKVASDRNWLDWIFRSQANRPFTQAERDSFVLVLARNALAYLNGTDGVYAPLSITPTDSTNMTFTLTFAPRLFDSTYRLFIGPNGQGINLKDFIDLNGSYVNTGNAMNQDRDGSNGEVPQGEFPYDTAPGDRFSTRLVVNNSDTGRFLSALFEDFRGTGAGGREPDNATFITLFGTVEVERLKALTNIANGLVGSAEQVNLLVEQTFQRYLRRAAGGDLAANSTAIQNGTLSVRQLVINLLASDEYFNNVVYGGGGNNQAWANAIYRDVLPGTTAPTYTGTPARATFASNLVLSDAAIQRTISEYFLRVLGRTPNRVANDARLDETTTYSAEVFTGTLFNFTTLLKSGPAAGQLSGDQRLIVALLGSQEYLRLNGNSNFEWLRSVYDEVLGRALGTPIDVVTPGGEFDLKLNQLLNLSGYTTARQSNLSTIINNVETRQRFYRDYSSFFLGRAPTAAELTSYESVYQANGLRLERVIAAIVRTAEYDPLSGPGASNSNWLEKVYQALLGRGTNGDATSVQQLAFLNSNTNPNNEAVLSNARNTVALQILETAEYRQRLLSHTSNPQGFFNKYLNRAATNTELTTFLNQFTNGAKQEDVLIAMLMGSEYYRLQ